MEITGVNGLPSQSTLVSRSYEADANVKYKLSQRKKERKGAYCSSIAESSSRSGWLQADSERAARVTDLPSSLETYEAL